MHRYGIGLGDLNKMMESQQGKCAICKEPLSLKVDHNHKTGKVRGLLCNGCNRGLGFFTDNMSVLESAICYLKSNI